MTVTMVAKQDELAVSSAYTATRPAHGSSGTSDQSHANVRKDQTSLCSRFFVDDGLWHDAPLLTGQTSFEPLPDVRNIMVTGGEGFMYGDQLCVKGILADITWWFLASPSPRCQVS